MSTTLLPPAASAHASGPEPAPASAAAIAADLDRARATGPLKTIRIPPCPELLVRMQRALALAEPDLGEVARIAGSDVAMAAVLLKRANSPAYTTGFPVSTVGQAMNRLGLDHTASEMRSFLVQRAIPAGGSQLQRFWQRSTQRAVALAFIARQLPGMSPDVAHTYGLFCHVGMPVMMQSLPGYNGTLMEAHARIDRPFIATENANHRTDHAVVGALVARVWGLAPEVMVAVRRHHDLEALGDASASPEAHTLVAAGLVAEHLTRRHEGQPPDADWTTHRERALRWLQIDSAEVSAWEEGVGSLLDEV
jgi:HD-like signal output (HDOD) protein